jgi:hypothetical protein
MRVSRALMIMVGISILAVAGCSDDSATPDASVDGALADGPGADGLTGDMAAGDLAPQPDGAPQPDMGPTPDTAPTPDLAPSPDSGKPAKVLGASHTGWGLKSWKHKNCYLAGCHTEAKLPKPVHPAGMGLWECGACHGGNGSCDPNGGMKKDHKTADNCMSACHGKHHGFTKNIECVGCHMPAVGGTALCP